MIVTLAGHVDHGKTTLVHRLTGIDTDSLAEERRRGLTIDLGFAYLEQDGYTIGFVDVPGHHRFIHNMVAGVAAQQFALLVIAADDGPMPQTREHLQILSLIGLRRGAIALTKCDRVDDERRAAVHAEIDALTQGSFLAGAPVIETAATIGLGIEKLRDELVRAAAAPMDSLGERPFRLAIDRAFSLKGAGVVVTGTVHGGTITADQEICHFPSGRRARVRSIHAQNKPVAAASVGDRAAINLAGIELESLHRGDWLTDSPAGGHRHLVIDFEPTADTAFAPHNWQAVHVYHATRHTTAKVARVGRPNAETATELRENAKIGPPKVADFGNESTRKPASILLEVDCDQPLLARHGDRIVIRDQGLDRTLGGGRVIDNRPRPRRRNATDRRATIEALLDEDPASCLAGLLALGPVNLTEWHALWDVSPEGLDAHWRQLPVSRRGQSLVSEAAWASWSSALQRECEQRHAADGTLAGMQENAFQARVPVAFRGELLRELVAKGQLTQRAGRYQPRQHEVRLSAQERALLDRISRLLAPPAPLSLGDIGKQLKIPLPALQRAVQPLIAKGMLARVNDKRLYLPDDLIALAQVAAELGRKGPFTAAEFRDAAGIGRNIAIDVLECFDDRRLTRRQGEHRIVVGDPLQAMAR